MGNLERLTKILRYAGLNLTPQMLQIILDQNVRDLIDTLAERLSKNPNLDLDEIDGIIDAINKAAVKQQEAEAAKAAAKEKGKKAAPKLEKA